MKPTPDTSTVQGVLAAMVRERLEANKVRQRDLALIVGISEKHLSQMLTGRAEGQLAMWDRLLNALPVDTAAATEGGEQRTIGDDAALREVQIATLLDAREAARENWRTVVNEGREHDVCRHWAGVAGWLKRRADWIAADYEPDWHDAARTTFALDDPAATP